MSSDVTRRGVLGRRPGREAVTGAQPEGSGAIGDGSGGRAGDDVFSSYYGQPVVRRPGWRELDIVGYLFVGGLAGGSSMLAAGQHLVGAHGASRRVRVTAAVGSITSLGLLIHDLGRPERFLNMLRVLKPTSPMNVGSWLLSAYAPATIVAALGDHVGVLRPLVRPATWAAGLLGSAMTAYTGVLLADTAVPAWHDADEELPFVFAGSSAMAAGGIGLLTAPPDESGPARRFALAGATIEIVASQLLHHRAGLMRPAHGGWLTRLSRPLSIAGVVAVVAGRRRRRFAQLGGVCLATASALTRTAIFRAGVRSADDPRFVVEPQRRRADARSPET